MEDDLGVNLLELLGGFGGVNERYEVGFRWINGSSEEGLRRRNIPFGERGGGFGGKGVWFEENMESSHSLVTFLTSE